MNTSLFLLFLISLSLILVVFFFLLALFFIFFLFPSSLLLAFSVFLSTFFFWLRNHRNWLSEINFCDSDKWSDRRKIFHKSCFFETPPLGPPFSSSPSEVPPSYSSQMLLWCKFFLFFRKRSEMFLRKKKARKSGLNHLRILKRYIWYFYQIIRISSHVVIINFIWENDGDVSICHFTKNAWIYSMTSRDS